MILDSDRLAGVALPMIMLLVTPADAYLGPTHGAIANAATSAANISAGGSLASMGLSFDVSDEQHKFPSASTGEPLSIRALIRAGAIAEDSPFVRSVNHFYDARHFGEGLTVPILGQIGYPSSSWAIGDSGQVSGDCVPVGDLRQCHDLAWLREYFYRALTVPDADSRKSYFGRTFEGLGHLIHHMGDMAQPQHVRNDLHLDIDALNRPILEYCVAPTTPTCVAYLAYKLIRNPSAYELWTNQRYAGPDIVASDLALLNGYASVYSAADTTTFNAPIKFWANDDDTLHPKGLAQFTASNFPSAGTIGYGTPGIGTYGYIDMDIQALCNGAVPACPAGLSGTVRMYAIPVTDHYRPEASGPNPYGVTSSIFDADLEKVPGGQRIFALNRFNYAYQQAYLLPRAVGYAAGIINYFFRGRMEIGLPDEGVYGIVDHNDPTAADPATGGFARIKLKVRNVTPTTDAAGNPSVEGMDDTGNATARLIAVAKFHRNLCYRPDLSGEYGTLLDAGTRLIDAQPGCRSETEDIVVSQPAAVPAGINAGAQAVTFDFGANRIPISATDLYLQVVYRGALGLEPDAVVVATRDISEPTYLHNYSRWDQYTYACPWPEVGSATVDGQVACVGPNGVGAAGSYTYAEWCATGGFQDLAECNQAMGLTVKYQFSPTAAPIAGYDPAGASAIPQGQWAPLPGEAPLSPVATMPAPVGTLARIAVLTDAAPANAGLLVIEWIDNRHGSALFQWLAGPAVATTSQADPATGAVATSVTYAPGRGAWLPSADNALLTSGTAHPPLVPGRSLIAF